MDDNDDLAEADALWPGMIGSMKVDKFGLGAWWPRPD
jgi:hypothetical protein